MSGAPLLIQTKLNLAQQGISAENVRFGFCTMESEEYICVKEKEDEKNILKLLNTSSGKVEKFPTAGDGAIMNPSKPWLALRGGLALQIFDPFARKKIASVKLSISESDSIVYWTWCRNNLIGIVTKERVFHWKVSEDLSDLQEAFKRHEKLSSSQIINYKVSYDERWCLLVGISKGDTPGSVNGNMQLYSVAKSVSQSLEGHAGNFAKITKGIAIAIFLLLDGDSVERNVISFIQKKPGEESKLFIMEVGRDRDDPAGVFKLPPQPIVYPSGAQDLADFAVSMVIANDKGLVYTITRKGFLFLFDIYTGKQVCGAQITADTIFATTISKSGTDFVGLTVKKGQMISAGVDGGALVPFLLRKNETELALSLCSRLNLPGAEDLVMQQYNNFLLSQDYASAAKVAASSPNGMLRTNETIQKFKGLQGNFLLQYFKVILEKGPLNKVESVELCRLILAQGNTQTLEKLIGEDKLYFSEELGEQILSYNSTHGDSRELYQLCLKIFLKSEAHESVIKTLVKVGQFDKIVPYCEKVGFTVDFPSILRTLAKQNSGGIGDFAKSLVLATPPLLKKEVAADILISHNLAQESTAFLLAVLKDDKAEDAKLQTKLLEMIITSKNDTVADAVFNNEMFHHFDRSYIGALLEKSGNFKRALQLHEEINDVRKCFPKYLNSLYSMQQEKDVTKPDEDFIVNYFNKLTEAHMMEMLGLIMETYRETKNQGCIRLFVAVGTEHSSSLNMPDVIELLEKHGSTEGIYFLTSNLLTSAPSPEIVYKMIESACTLEQYEVVAKIIKENEFVDPIRDQLKNFFLIEKFSDPRPFIHLCDRFGFVDELTTYLVNNDFIRHLEIYVEKVNPGRASQVVAKLIDLDCPEKLVKTVLNYDSVRANVDYEDLVESLEKRNKLYLIKDILEEKITVEKSTDIVVHNALAKLKILTNSGAKEFLETDSYYEHKVVGKFCENFDPSLAFICYAKSNGDCDVELVNVSVQNELYKELSLYCIDRQSTELWDMIVTYNENSSESVSTGGAATLKLTEAEKKKIIDTVVNYGLPQTKDQGKVTVCLKSFMKADMPNELIDLLDKLILQPDSTFTTSSLENLLLLTAVKTRREKVMYYIKVLKTYDGENIAEACLNQAEPLTEEALEIYINKNLNVKAMEVIIDYLNDVERAVDFAKSLNFIGNTFDNDLERRQEKKDVLSVLARHLHQKGEIKEALTYYIEAANPAHFAPLITSTKELNQEEVYAVLVEFLQMARKKQKEKLIDTTLVYAYCKLGQMKQLEQFLLTPNLAEVGKIAQEIYNEPQASQKDLETCIILFSNDSNHKMLSLCYLKLKRFTKAVDAAKKANDVETWKLVNIGCLDNNEVELANIAGLNIIANPVYLDDVVSLYEQKGFFKEVVWLLESGVNVENAHNNTFTMLAILYAKYSDFLDLKKNVLIDFVRRQGKKINSTKFVRISQSLLKYEEVAELYRIMGELESALSVLLSHTQFFADPKETVYGIILSQSESTVIRQESVYYRLLDLFVKLFPTSVSQLLDSIHSQRTKGRESKPVKLDCSRVIKTLSAVGKLVLAREFLVQLQIENLRFETESKAKQKANLKKYQKDYEISFSYDMSAVNEAVNDLYIEEGSWELLRESIDKHTNFDHLKLARRLRESDNINFRQLSAKIFMGLKKYSEGMEICEKDDRFDECLIFARNSNDELICEDLLRKFASKGKERYFAALLVSCSHIIAPDIALELGWSKGWTNLTTPFMIQQLHKDRKHIQSLEERLTKLEGERNEEREKERQATMRNNGLSGNPMLANSSFNGL
eukprot:maker-scaffold_18-snap-gene-1.5-mRNA-1 protein AED:0.42 eAED:0.42 QI:0/0/0/0.66/1/1/3/0/1799